MPECPPHRSVVEELQQFGLESLVPTLHRPPFSPEDAMPPLIVWFDVRIFLFSCYQLLEVRVLHEALIQSKISDFKVTMAYNSTLGLCRDNALVHTFSFHFWYCIWKSYPMSFELYFC
ncbi:hypothetical protein KSP39_PZI010815 [Platanthera zijinensis]|uniref:Uncharacterized protein n=1 Tax=Platanthera zijinensis TaxID=2320716 RepID=A0AAP0BHG9_9ASPA